jgi:hypothetical protein
MRRRYTRRGFVAGAAVVLSGCLGGGEDTDESTNGDDGTGTGGDTEDRTNGNGTADDTTGEETNEGADDTRDDLDLREANVTGVSFSEQEGGRYLFGVTLYHDDDGENGYADWWQVESLEGDRLGRRDLTHAHGTQEFTRSETVDTGDRNCVVVRGHDQTHGYGGRAVVVNVETGETSGFIQGEEPSSFDEEDCP